MAGTGVLTGEGFRVIWSAVKGRTTTDWKAVAAAYREIIEDPKAFLADPVAASLGLPGALDAIESLHTTVGEPGDRLEVKEERT